MTYRTLIKLLSQVPDNRLNDAVTIYDAQEDEFFDVVSLKTATDDESDPAAGVLDEDHLYLKLDK